MVYISAGGQVVQNDGWSIQKVKRTFWNFVDGVLLFFQTLISPASNRRGSRYVTQYGAPGSSGRSQRRIGRPGNVSGVAAPPCGAGGG
ncbi:selenoprotein K-like [Daphnia carinata]|uniref:selenoprotein K-like n=1 Tax=Daphnia carinata TaxID=120202 RepID=UPI00257B61F8|nr:selenoprotein K-like [Daphnia carinata]XP_059350488.1 selenoprotein K-like [Daphnia carinata]